MSALYEAGPQSGGRTPAPGRLAYVQAFANSFFDLGDDWGEDRFATPAGLERWLQARGLAAGRVTPGEHRRALAIRAGLRAQFAEHNGVAPDPGARQRLREAIAGLPAGYALDDDGALAPDPAVTGVQGALGLLVAIVHESQLDGTWARLKACPGPPLRLGLLRRLAQRREHLVLDAGLRQPREGARVPSPGARRVRTATGVGRGASEGFPPGDLARTGVFRCCRGRSRPPIRTSPRSRPHAAQAAPTALPVDPDRHDRADRRHRRHRDRRGRDHHQPRPACERCR